MAKTITPKLTVTGSSADWGNAISLSVTDTLTCEAPSKGIGRVDVTTSGSPVVLLAAGSAGTTFLYVKNNNTTGTGYIDIETDGSAVFGTLHNGEFAWIPLDTAVGVEVNAVNATVEVEYAYWTRTAS